MNKEGIIVKLKEIFHLVVNSKVNVDELDENGIITRDLGVNSIGLIYLAVAIEKTFNIDMSNVTINTFNTIGDVVEFIEKGTK